MVPQSSSEPGCCRRLRVVPARHDIGEHLVIFVSASLHKPPENGALLAEHAAIVKPKSAAAQNAARQDASADPINVSMLVLLVALA